MQICLEPPYRLQLEFLCFEKSSEILKQNAILEAVAKFPNFDCKGVKNDIESKFRIINIRCAHTFSVAISALVGILRFEKSSEILRTNAKMEVISKLSIFDWKGVKKAKKNSKKTSFFIPPLILEIVIFRWHSVADRSQQRRY